MGFFSKREPVELDTELAGMLTGYPPAKEQKALRAVAKSQEAIHRVTKDLRPGEELRLFVIDAYLSNFVLVTNQRSVEPDRYNTKEIEHADVAKTYLGTMPGTGHTLLEIVSKSALLDYRPDDHARYGAIIQFKSELPRAAAEIIAELKRHTSAA